MNIIHPIVLMRKINDWLGEDVAFESWGNFRHYIWRLTLLYAAVGLIGGTGTTLFLMIYGVFR